MEMTVCGVRAEAVAGVGAGAGAPAGACDDRATGEADAEADGSAGAAVRRRRPSDGDVPRADMSAFGDGPKDGGNGGRSAAKRSGWLQGSTGRRRHGSCAKRQGAR